MGEHTPRSSTDSAGGVEWNWDERDVRRKWDAFAKFGNASATEMTGKNLDKWLKDAGVLDNKRVTTIMTGIAFSKVAGPKRKTLKYGEIKKVLATVADDASRQSKESVQQELDAITERLGRIDAPSINSAAKGNTGGGVFGRLTDHRGYTGSHKERFDPEGKGRGKAGRVDEVQHSGYVGSYKNAGKYDRLHGKDK